MSRTLTPRYSSPIAASVRCRSIQAFLASAGVSAALLCAFGVNPARAGPPVIRLGVGAREVWVFRPSAPAKSIVVFGHGWSTPLPAGFGPWVEHLRAGGSIVIYPRYRVGGGGGGGDSTIAALAAFEAGIESAFKRIGKIGVPVIAIGKSFGGSAVFYYAAAARSRGLPVPAAILSIFPAGPIGAFPAERPSARTYVEFFVGDADTIAGSGGADTFWRWLGGHRSDLKRYVVIHSRSGFVANHDSAQRTDAIARDVFWKPLDVLIRRASARR